MKPNININNPDVNQPFGLIANQTENNAYTFPTPLPFNGTNNNEKLQIIAPQIIALGGGYIEPNRLNKPISHTYKTANLPLMPISLAIGSDLLGFKGNAHIFATPVPFTENFNLMHKDGDNEINKIFILTKTQEGEESFKNATAENVKPLFGKIDEMRNKAIQEKKPLVLFWSQGSADIKQQKQDMLNIMHRGYSDYMYHTIPIFFSPDGTIVAPLNFNLMPSMQAMSEYCQKTYPENYITGVGIDSYSKNNEGVEVNDTPMTSACRTGTLALKCAQVFLKNNGKILKEISNGDNNFKYPDACAKHLDQTSERCNVINPSNQEIDLLQQKINAQMIEEHNRIMLNTRTYRSPDEIAKVNIANLSSNDSNKLNKIESPNDNIAQKYFDKWKNKNQISSEPLGK